jgi:hypothetical protein
MEILLESIEHIFQLYHYKLDVLELKKNRKINVLKHNRLKLIYRVMFYISVLAVLLWFHVPTWLLIITIVSSALTTVEVVRKILIINQNL